MTNQKGLIQYKPLKNILNIGWSGYAFRNSIQTVDVISTLAEWRPLNKGLYSVNPFSSDPWHQQNISSKQPLRMRYFKGTLWTIETVDKELVKHSDQRVWL